MSGQSVKITLGAQTRLSREQQMNSLDIILFIAGAGALFLLYVVAYSDGHREGERAGYMRGRSISRRANDNLDHIINSEIKKQVTQ